MMKTDGWTEITEEQYRALKARFDSQKADRKAAAAVRAAYACAAARHGAEYSGHACDACRAQVVVATKRSA